MHSNAKVEMVVGKVIYQTIRDWFGAVALGKIRDNGDFDLLWSELSAVIGEAYRYGVVDGLNTTYQSPYKCGECGRDNLVLDSNVKWDKTRKDWSVTWKETSEAYCENCDQQVAVYLKLYGDYENENI